VGYAHFCCVVQKLGCYPCNLWHYWTDHIKFAENVTKILPLNIFESQMRYSNILELQPAKWRSVCQFLPKLVAKTTSLKEAERGPDRSFTNKYYHLEKKIVKIGQVDPELIGLQTIFKRRKKFMQAKHTALSACLPSITKWLNTCDQPHNTQVYLTKVISQQLTAQALTTEHFTSTQTNWS